MLGKGNLRFALSPLPSKKNVVPFLFILKIGLYDNYKLHDAATIYMQLQLLNISHILFKNIDGSFANDFNVN